VSLGRGFANPRRRLIVAWLLENRFISKSVSPKILWGRMWYEMGFAKNNLIISYGYIFYWRREWDSLPLACPEKTQLRALSATGENVVYHRCVPLYGASAKPGLLVQGFGQAVVQGFARWGVTAT